MFCWIFRLFWHSSRGGRGGEREGEEWWGLAAIQNKCSLHGSTLQIGYIDTYDELYLKILVIPKLWSMYWNYKLNNTVLYRARLKGGPQVCCCCLPLLPGLAWRIHATWGPPFTTPVVLECVIQSDIDCMEADIIRPSRARFKSLCKPPPSLWWENGNGRVLVNIQEICGNITARCTGLGWKAVLMFGKFCSCSCLPLL